MGWDVRIYLTSGGGGGDGGPTTAAAVATGRKRGYSALGAGEELADEVVEQDREKEQADELATLCSGTVGGDQRGVLAEQGSGRLVQYVRQGRPDLTGLLHGMQTALHEKHGNTRRRDTGGTVVTDDVTECAVLSCGPRTLQAATKAACATAAATSCGCSGLTFEYHSEGFEW